MRILNTFLFSVLFLGLAGAQSKLAHLNIQELLSQMPEMKTVQAELKKLETSYTTDIQNSLKELQTKAEAYQGEANGLSQEQLTKRTEEFQKKAQELQTMEANIQQARQTAGQELQKKQEELMAPVIKKAQDAIHKVAKAKGYNYVLDSTTGGSLVFFEGGKDIMPEVKKELGF